MPDASQADADWMIGRAAPGSGLVAHAERGEDLRQGTGRGGGARLLRSDMSHQHLPWSRGGDWSTVSAPLRSHRLPRCYERLTSSLTSP